MKKSIPIISFGLLAAITFTGCETSGGNAMLGAATGAAIGGLLHRSGHGGLSRGAGRGRGGDALTGAAIGAGAGYLIGKVVRNERRAREERYYRERYYEGGDYDRY